MTTKSDGSQGALSPAQEPGQPGDLEERIAAIVAATLAKSLPESLNPVAGTLRRLKADVEELRAKQETPPATGDPERAPKKDDEVSALRKRLDAAEAREREKDLQLAKSRRDTALREAIADANAFDVDAVFRQLTHPDNQRLKVDKDGNYYAEAPDGSFLTPSEFVRKCVEASPWMQKAPGKQGGGSAPPGTPGGQVKVDPSLPPEERLRQYHEQSKPDAA